jgi:transcriptional regulator with XRE-family HTH domain
MRDRTTQPVDVALRELMREQGLTDTALAARTPYNQSTISRYLSRGRGRVLNRETIATISEMARAPGKDPEYFLEVRIYQARAELEQVMREGLLSLEDMRKPVKKARSRRGDQSRLDSS